MAGICEHRNALFCSLRAAYILTNSATICFLRNILQNGISWPLFLFLYISTKRATRTLLPQADRWLAPLSLLLAAHPLSSFKPFWVHSCETVSGYISKSQYNWLFHSKNITWYSCDHVMSIRHRHINISYSIITRFTDRAGNTITI
jgi:hypothetical protein